MDLSMTIDTRKSWEMNLAVTFDTKGSHVPADQKEFIRRSMGSVASVTPFELLWSMLKNPWASLLGVAFIADVRVKFVHFSQAGVVSASVGCMTVRAFQCPSDDPMIVGKIKLGLNLPMAGETEIRVFCFQKVFGDLGSMNLMAVITANRAELMDSSRELKQFLLLLMTLQADIRLHYCVFVFKGENESLSFCLSMFSTWTMARFAFSSPMGIFLKKIVDFRMTPFTRLSPYIPFLLGLHLLLAK